MYDECNFLTSMCKITYNELKDIKMNEWMFHLFTHVIPCVVITIEYLIVFHRHTLYIYTHTGMIYFFQGIAMSALLYGWNT